jgi:hypothetical protein
VAPPPEPEEHGIFCQRCGTGNDVRRHFCRRCGSSLMMGSTAVRVPWYRRLFGQRAAPVAGDRRAAPGPTAGAVLRTFLATVLLVFLVGGGLAYAALPGLRDAVNQRVGRTTTDLRRTFLNPGYAEVRPRDVRATSEISGHPARNAADLITNDYWAADAARDPTPTLVFSFNGPTDVDALLVTSGAPSPDYARLARPRTVELTYSDGTGEKLTLNDDPRAVSYTIHARQTTSLTMKITSVYGVAGTSTVALTEVEFFHLK